MNRKVFKHECENCGGPLQSTAFRGKYHCPYCNADYFDSSYQEPEQPLSIPLKTPIADRTPKKSNQRLFLIILGAGLAICLGWTVFSSLLFTGPAQIAKATLEPTPPMLAVLPQTAVAGAPIAYQGVEIIVHPEVEVSQGLLFIKIDLRNWSETALIHRYKPKQIIVYDDRNNQYEIYAGNCDLDIPFMDRQITINARQKLKLSSSQSWCSDEKALPVFSGVIPVEAKHLYVRLENFGVFSLITFVIDL